MATGSASNGVYFNQFGLEDELTFTDQTTKEPVYDLVTGAAAIATSPALYAYFMAAESYNIPPQKMTMTDIGTIAGNTDKITSNVNLL